MIALALVFGTTALAFDHQDCSQKHSAEHTVCKYMRKYERVYTPDEFNQRFNNVMARSEHASHSDEGVQYGLNSISDRPFVKNNRLNSEKPYTGIQHHPKLLQAYKLPKSLDLRDKMQPVKDQGACGSCYTFAGVSVLEYHAGVSISEQKIMDCSSSSNGPSYGCDGGWPETIFEYARHSPVALEKDLPYTAKNAPCNQTCAGSVLHVDRYGTLTREKDELSESRLPYILNTHGPVAVAIDVGTTELLMSYQEGVFPGMACGDTVDHAVTIVGYTEKYWIMRNSWSEDWGDDGYFYLERGVNACGVANYIGYVSETH